MSTPTGAPAKVDPVRATGGSSFGDALHYELVRIRTIRSTWWLTGVAVAVGLLIAVGIAVGTAVEMSGPPSPDDQRFLGAAVLSSAAAVGAPCLVGYVLAMIGIFAWGHEYRHGMIRASLTALNSRGFLWSAKFLVAGAWVAVVSAVTMLAAGCIGWLVLRQHDIPVFSGQNLALVGRVVAYVLVLTWLAMAFTALTRSQAFALVLLFLWPLLIESVITLILSLVPGLKDHADLARFLPFGAGARMIDITRDADSTFGDPLSALGGFVIFGGLAAVLMIVAWVLFRRRDA